MKRILFLIIVALLILPSQVYAACPGGVCYAGPTGTGTECTAAAPCTLTYAVATKAAAGESVKIQDGTLVEASYIAPAVANLNIDCVNEYACTVQNGASGGTRVVYIGTAATGITFGKLVIDAAGDETYSVDTASSSTINAVTFSGTRLVNYKNCGFNTIKGGAVTATDITCSSGYSGNRSCLFVTTSGDGAVSVSGHDITQTQMGVSGQAHPGVATSTAQWQIKKLTYDGTTSNCTAVQYASGANDYSAVWDDRASYTYS